MLSKRNRSVYAHLPSKYRFNRDLKTDRLSGRNVYQEIEIPEASPTVKKFSH